MKKRLIILLLILFTFHTWAAPPPQAGIILEVRGDAFIDHFGSNSFTPMSPNEILYRQSIIRTDDSGFATLNVGEDIIQIPPKTIISIDVILSTQENQKKFSWFDTLVSGLKSRAREIIQEEESVPLGTDTDGSLREFKPEMMDEDWVAQKTIKKAELKIKEENYVEASVLLDSLSQNYDSPYVRQLLGYCFFRLGLHKKSISTLLPLREKSPFVYAQMALSYYLLGKHKEALPLLKKSKELFLNLKLEEEYNRLEEKF